MSASQQGSINLETDVQWQAESLQFGSDGFRTTKNGKAFHARARTEAAALQAAGWEGSVDPDGDSPISNITATIPALDPDNPDDSLNPTWNLDAQFKNVPAAKSQAFKTFIIANGGYNGATFRAIMEAVDAYEKDKDWTLYDALTGFTQAWAFDIINDNSLLELDAVLSRSNNYARSTVHTADWTNVGWIFDTADIIAITDPPNAIIGALPAAGHWLKSPPSLTYGSDGRVTTTNIWIYGTAETYPAHQYPHL
jgi:hypothetical protein